MNVPGLKELIGNAMMLTFALIAVTYFMHEIATRIKNKKKLKQKQRDIRLALKILKSVY